MKEKKVKKSDTLVMILLLEMNEIIETHGLLYNVFTLGEEPPSIFQSSCCTIEALETFKVLLQCLESYCGQSGIQFDRAASEDDITSRWKEIKRVFYHFCVELGITDEDEE